MLVIHDNMPIVIHERHPELKRPGVSLERRKQYVSSRALGHATLYSRDRRLGGTAGACDRRLA
jgi:hypothetical protein